MMAGNRAADSSSIPMTTKFERWSPGDQHWFFRFLSRAITRLTIVDHFELSDQVQPDFGELVLQQRKEEGQKMFLGSLLAQ
jgi:hypothetical protein